jgi:hypothetical protein
VSFEKSQKIKINGYVKTNPDFYKNLKVELRSGADINSNILVKTYFLEINRYFEFNLNANQNFFLRIVCSLDKNLYDFEDFIYKVQKDKFNGIVLEFPIKNNHY